MTYCYEESEEQKSKIVPRKKCKKINTKDRKIMVLLLIFFPFARGSMDLRKGQVLLPHLLDQYLESRGINTISNT